MDRMKSLISTFLLTQTCTLVRMPGILEDLKAKHFLSPAAPVTSPCPPSQYDKACKRVLFQRVGSQAFVADTYRLPVAASIFHPLR